MTVGNLFWAWMADRAQTRAAIAALIFSAVSLALFSVLAHNIWTLCLDVLLIGFSGGLGTILQTRLMDVAGDAQALAAAAHHSAFNTANAIGPWLGGLAITAGWGLTSTGWIGALLALGGLVVFLFAAALRKRDDLRPATA
jgi:DHA1 family inner membrane transport protein